MTSGPNTLLIDGRWCESQRTMPVHNPFTGEVLQEVACADADTVTRALLSASKGLSRARRLSTGRRSELLHAVARQVATHKDEFAALITAESGKPITAAYKEVSRCINTLTLSAEEAIRIVGETINFDSFAGGEQRSGYFQYEALGIVVAITPFNDPLNLVAHKLGPALAAGNAVILKPSEQAPLSALRLVRAFIDAGLPEGMVNVLTGYGAEFGDQLLSAPDVAMVSFTGGERAALRIGTAAGAKKLLMELGANSPVIVARQCDLLRAVAGCVDGAFWASGQNCIGVQRVYVQRERYDEFAEALVQATAALKTGDPAQVTTDVGPLISLRDVDRVAQWVNTAKAQGAQCMLGGRVLPGNCYAPTVLAMGDQDVPIAAREVFGPVVSLHSFDTLQEAVALANRPDYMIHGAIFTDSLQEAMYASRHLECAGVLINDSTDYRLDAMPFGGAKRGALGREGVKHAIREMVQTKTICMNLADLA